jgi:diacylglycerol kinase family enzyme
MTRRKKSKAGRPSLGDRGRTKVVTVKLSEIEYQAIAEAVARENAEVAASGGDGTVATVSSWLRDHALDPLGLATFRGDT